VAPRDHYPALSRSRILKPVDGQAEHESRRPVLRPHAPPVVPSGGFHCRWRPQGRSSLRAACRSRLLSAAWRPIGAALGQAAVSWFKGSSTMRSSR
jgi:hypothetical protein